MSKDRGERFDLVKTARGKKVHGIGEVLFSIYLAPT